MKGNHPISFRLNKNMRPQIHESHGEFYLEVHLPPGEPLTVTVAGGLFDSVPQALRGELQDKAHRMIEREVILTHLVE